MVKFYKTVSEEDQYLLYDVDKEYGFFFNKWGVFGRAENNSYLCDLEVSFDNFFSHFKKYIENIEKAQKELIGVIF